MSKSANIYYQDDEWWCDFLDEDGWQRHYEASRCIGIMASWLQEKDAEIERLKQEVIELHARLNPPYCLTCSGFHWGPCEIGFQGTAGKAW